MNCPEYCPCPLFICCSWLLCMSAKLGYKWFGLLFWASSRTNIAMVEPAGGIFFLFLVSVLARFLSA